LKSIDTSSYEVTTIGKHSFDSCTNLKKVELGENIKTIKTNAFLNSGLEEVKITTSSDIVIETSAFGKCASLKTISIEGKSKNYMTSDNMLIQKYKQGGVEENILLQYPISKTDEVVKITGINVIGPNAFAGNENIKEVVFDENVHTISVGAFVNCKNLKNVTFTPQLKTIMVHAFRGTGFEELVLPDTVEFIGVSAFSKLDRLTKLRIEMLNSSTIDSLAFANCEKLTDVEYTQLKSLSCATDIFEDCNSLESVKVDYNYDITTKKFCGVKVVSDKGVLTTITMLLIIIFIAI